jgi:Right handed beta helix region
MSRTHAIAFLLSIVAALATTATHAVQRTFVASNGSDANTAANCSLAAPCRGFAAAQTVTDSNGEIIVLDSAGYGAVTIIKSISIIAPTGVYGGISVFSGGNGVTIATPGVNVVLRGLNINGQGGTNGINMTAGNKLTVENCVISNLTQFGISVNADATVRVTDTIIRDNGNHGIWLQNGANGTVTRAVISGNAANGVRVEGTSGAFTTTADISESTVDGNLTEGIVARALIVNSTIKVSIRDSRIVRNSFGLIAESGSSSAVVILSASNNMVVNNNGGGVAAFNLGARVWVSGNTVSNNSGTALINSSAQFISVGNNSIYGNNAVSGGTITTIAPM